MKAFSLLGSLAAAFAASTDDFVVTPFRMAPFAPLNATTFSGIIKSTGRPFTAHVGIVQDGSLFSIQLPPDGCTVHRAVSAAVAEYLPQCELATNGGFFAFTPPACQNSLIVDGKTVLWDGANRTKFGIVNGSAAGIGYLSSEGKYNFTSLIEGVGWLVRDGKVYVSSSREYSPGDGFFTEKAPRTGLGIHEDGSVMTMVVDGIESTDAGPDLFEFAEIFTYVGAKHAMNIDGGGSSDAVLKGKVWSRPTCQDTPTPICERNVTSITCIAYAKEDAN